MSKLFNTLEKIRNNEAVRPTTGGQRKERSGLSKKTVLTIAAVLGALLAMGLLYFIRPPAGLMTQLDPPADRLTGPEQSTPAHSGPKRQIPVSGYPEGQPTVGGQTDEQTYLSSPATLKNMQEKLARATDLPADSRAVLLNNIAAYHIYNQQYWKGLYFLEKAMAEAPVSVEPLINYAVALTEMGLYGVAGNYLKQAYLLDPSHPALLKNTALLKQSHIMDETLNSLYSQ